MTQWLRLTNELKRKPAISLLTHSQKLALQDLQSLLYFPNWYNLYGPPGSGKTMLGRALATAQGASYCVLPSEIDHIDAGEYGVIIDNVSHSEGDIRRLLARLELRGYQSCVLITRHPSQLPMPRVRLDLPKPEDLAHIRNTLEHLTYPVDIQRLPDTPSLWDVLQACLY